MLTRLWLWLSGERVVARAYREAQARAMRARWGA